MPFQVLTTITKPLKETRASISYMRYKRKDKISRDGVPKLIIGIPRGMLSNFKPKDGQLFELHVGTGNDAGKARILAGRAGIAPTVLKQCIVFRFGYVPMLGDDMADKEFVDGHAIEGSGFEIVLPPWFKASERVAPAVPSKTPQKK